MKKVDEVAEALLETIDEGISNDWVILEGDHDII